MKKWLLILVVLMVIPLVSAKPQINEIMYNPIGDDYNFEFLEIYFDAETNVSGWYMEGINFKFPAGAMVDGYLIVANTCKDNTTEEENDFMDRYKKPCLYEYVGTLGNEGEMIELYDSSGGLIDSVNYSVKWGGLKRGSLEKQETGMWIESENDYGSPGEKNSLGIKKEEPVVEDEPIVNDEDAKEVLDDGKEEDASMDDEGTNAPKDDLKVYIHDDTNNKTMPGNIVLELGKNSNTNYTQNTTKPAESSKEKSKQWASYGLIGILIILLGWFAFKKK